MAQAAAAERRIGYSKARLLVIGVGLAILALVTIVMLARGVDRSEVAGNLLFIPVFVAFIFFNVRGGVVAAILATAGYIALRYSAILTVGWDQFAGQIIFRASSYLIFGVLGGWANKQLETSLTKLELYDQIDDSTGLFNARFFLQDTDLEVSRARRYQTLFSIAAINIPTSAFDTLSRRQKSGALKELGRMLADSVRTVDRAVHAKAKDHYKMAVVLPETAGEGARIFVERLADNVADYLIKRGAPLTREQVIRIAITYPGDDAPLESLRAEFAEIDRAEHPEESESPGGTGAS